MVIELPPGVDPDAIRGMMSRFRENRHAIEERWEQLLADHDGDWVASHDGGFVFGRTLEDVLGAASNIGWPLDVVALDQLRRERANVLL